MTLEAVNAQGIKVSDSSKKKDVAKNITNQMLALSGATGVGALGGLVADKFMHQGYKDSESFIGKRILKQFDEYFKNYLKKEKMVDIPGVSVEIDEAALKTDLFKTYNKEFFQQFGYKIKESTNELIGKPFTKLGAKLGLAAGAVGLAIYGVAKLIKSSNKNAEK